MEQHRAQEQADHQLEDLGHPAPLAPPMASSSAARSKARSSSTASVLASLGPAGRAWRRRRASASRVARSGSGRSTRRCRAGPASNRPSARSPRARSGSPSPKKPRATERVAKWISEVDLAPPQGSSGLLWPDAGSWWRGAEFSRSPASATLTPVTRVRVSLGSPQTSELPTSHARRRPGPVPSAPPLP